MKCDKCLRDFPEPQIQDSHDVPCYLFKGFNRKEKKNQADKFGRHWLCGECHELYEEELRKALMFSATLFCSEWIGGNL